MAEIKRIDKNTDFNTLKMSKMGWDTFCYGAHRYYDVYRIEGYNHAIGGKWGENCYYACPIGEKPTYENLVQFSGEVCCWGFRVENRNSLKSKWDEYDMTSNYLFTVTRNEKDFYSFGANDMDFGISKARQILFKVHEHPISFNERDFAKSIVGRKIYWREQPAIIKSYCMNGNLWIIPEGVPAFKRPAYTDDVTEYMDMCEDDTGEDGGIAEDLFSEGIYWFRSKDYTKVEEENEDGTIK